ncbi:2-dehydropantoate 2-reductase N-terminal domain-containing protein [Streptomyces sp. NPDC014724]|uniref:2-dehydropantoate 2-reductase N-terminal domain-containing protein n=1 Tax=unclassified Streptomyces TaxID=2593676 RepID=UPI003701F592
MRYIVGAGAGAVGGAIGGRLSEAGHDTVLVALVDAVSRNRGSRSASPFFKTVVSGGS